MRKPLLFICLLLFSTVETPAQTSDAQTVPLPSATRPRIVGAPSPTPPAQSAPPTPNSPAKVVTPTVVPTAPPQPVQPLPYGKVKTKLEEAKRALRSRPKLTAAGNSATFFVTLTAYDPATSQLHLIALPKQTFLTPGAETTVSTSNGKLVRVRILRPNYVNTAVEITDVATGRHLAPLVVEYPIEKGGAFREMAYYVSAHPALLTDDLVRAGREYVRSMVDLAAKRLRDKGVSISPQILDIAERLCVVEHVDHDRFMRESRLKLFEEIYALYGLNELDTYRYSVSSAGAGGMVQMIPSTYRMVRDRYPAIGLNPDFVLGMRNHGNALEAMLLYMRDTWNDLAQDPDVAYAVSVGWATQDELIAAGYNSNPARLPSYIRRGGADWRALIPRETQIYLQIYRALDSLIPLERRADKAEKPKLADSLEKPAKPTPLAPTGSAPLPSAIPGIGGPRL
ncbi:MAG: hypothetical protein C4334_03115 [Pyrinomonas sp.]|uniref:hypothetical protein n=1 Tax=Pyrinomonas sp. TaxID=2080306 RepID=UPI00331C961D